MRLNKKRGFIKNFIITRKDCDLVQIFETIKKNIYSDDINSKQLHRFIQKNGFLIKDYEFECLCIDLKAKSGIKYSFFEQLFENDYFFSDLIVENTMVRQKQQTAENQFRNSCKLNQMENKYNWKKTRTQKFESSNPILIKQN